MGPENFAEEDQQGNSSSDPSGLIPQGSDGGGENKKADAGRVLRTKAVHEGSVVEKQCIFQRKKQCKGRDVVTRIRLHIWRMEQLIHTDM